MTIGIVLTGLLGPAVPSAGAGPSSLPSGYHTADQITAALQQLAAGNPSIATVQAIGPTWATTQGTANRSIWALRLCAGCTTSARPSVVFIGGQHAREISTPEVLLDFANDLVTRWPGDPDVAYLLQNTAIWIIPVANPDGHVQVENGLTNWRKNVDSANNAPADASLTLPNGIGVDLNRNFGYEWGQGGASATPGDYNYQGPSAFSEPEDQAMRDFLTAVHPSVLVDYHSDLAAVIWPWGYQSAPAADAATLSAAGTRLADLAGYSFGQTYAQVGLTTGDTLDWSYGALGIVALGVELDQGFAPDIATVGNVWLKNRTGLYDAARWSLAPARAQGPGVNAASLTAGAGQANLQITFSTAHEPGRTVAAAAYSVDQSDPSRGGSPLSITPTTNGVSTATSTIPEALGAHRVYVAAQDSSGQWGPVTALGYAYSPNAVYLPTFP